MKLFQRAKTGKVKWIEVYTNGATMISEWGVSGSDKSQRVEKVCTAKNVGKANEISPEDQAIVEMEAKLQKKRDKGYVENLDEIHETAVVDIDLDNIPKSFCPSKPSPQKNMKAEFEAHKDTYGQRKRDGHCIILVKTATQDLVYSRGMEDITFYMKELPVVQEFFKGMQAGAMILTEICFIKDGKDNTRQVSKIVRKKDPVAVVERYTEAVKEGVFEIVPFDIMFSEGKFVGEKTYTERVKLLKLSANNVPEIYVDWKSKIAHAHENEWEGFILRNDTLGSQIKYSLNGKADRAGAFKYLSIGPEAELPHDDFVVTQANPGKSGRHAKYYAQFELAQYHNGELTNFGNCGPGIFKDEELINLKERIDSGELSLPFVVEVEYRDREPDSGKLKFPILQRLREDKRVEECIYSEELKEA